MCLHHDFGERITMELQQETTKDKKADDSTASEALLDDVFHVLGNLLSFFSISQNSC